jgi:hypothetical protein
LRKRDPSFPQPISTGAPSSWHFVKPPRRRWVRVALLKRAGSTRAPSEARRGHRRSADTSP